MNNLEKKVKRGLWRQRIGYGSSDFACNLIWQMISLYLLFFYTNVMHLNAGAVSIMFLVTKVIDGISDLVVGFLIDKTNTRWGKSRPWILFGAVPFGAFLNIHIKCSRLSYPTSSQIAGIELSEFPGNAETGQLCRRNFCRISVL